MLSKKIRNAIVAAACVGLIILCFVYSIPKLNFDSKFFHTETQQVTSTNATRDKSVLYCYRIKSESLPDITKTTPPEGRSIFFLETTCKSYEADKITIEKRQACAVESAAHANPNHTVYLLYVSPGTLKLEGTQSDRLLEALLSYPNVKLMYLNFESYINGTPAQNVFHKVQSSPYAQSHASDMLRFLTLWKYGGTYMDLDVVVLKPLDGLAETFAGAETNTDCGSAILRFNSSGAGHVHAESCLMDFSRNYRPNVWGYNGPGVLTRLVKKVCRVAQPGEAFNRTCDGFTLYPPSYFFPVNYTNWRHYFEEEFTERVMRETSGSYVVHVWNKLSEVSAMIPVTANVSYVKFAEKYCPKVFEQCDKYF